MGRSTIWTVGVFRSKMFIVFFSSLSEPSICSFLPSRTTGIRYNLANYRDLDLMCISSRSR